MDYRKIEKKSKKPLGIYIHIPFCKSKCYYCDFISFSNKESLVERYIQCLLKEIDNKKKEMKEEILISTIYIGGGTPSHINSKYIKRILDNIKENWEVKENVEITIEVNPGTVNNQKLEEYFLCGINRLSIGLQTTNNMLLKQIGRIHTYEEFLDTYKIAKQIGFKNINVDLILGIPNQTVNDLVHSVEEIIKINPNHISIYSLIVEEGTILERMIEEGRAKLPSEDIERQMYWKIKEILEHNKYIHYEISNFSKEGYESKHNTDCWNQKEYFGFGLAAHSYYENKRYCNLDNMESYIKNIEEGKCKENIITCEIQNEEEKRKEYMLLGLRKIEGVNIQEFKNRFIQNPIFIFKDELQELVEKDLIEIDLNQIKLTNKGIDLANLVWEKFV